MSTSSIQKLSDLEKQRRALEAQMAQLNAAAEAERGRAEASAANPSNIESQPQSDVPPTPVAAVPTQVAAAPAASANAVESPPAPPAPQPVASAAVVPPADEPTEEDDDPDDESGSLVGLRGWMKQAPPLLVSTVFHAMALILLALMTFAMPEKDQRGVVMKSAQAEDAALEEMADVEIEVEELPELENISVAITKPDPGMIAFGDVTAAVSEVAQGVGDVELQPTTIGEIGAMFGKDGEGMSDVGEGMQAAASFFGAKSTGSRFIFVVDNSNSMGGGKFETVMDELVRSVDKLGPKQRFYVIFFSDVAYPLFHPNPPYGMVRATPENKQKLKAWLYTVEMCLRTRGRASVEKALSMRPDAIYILGDGAFTDDTAKMLTAPHDRFTVIHTVGMQVSDRGRTQLEAIAKANKGTFRSVQSAPAARAMAKANPIKRNNTYGPVWGLDLPKNKKK